MIVDAERLMGKPATRIDGAAKVTGQARFADSYEAAREAGYKVVAEYDAEAPSASFDSPGVEIERKVAKERPDPHVGDAHAAFAASPVQVDARYETPTQHHNPIELFTTTC